MSLSGSPSWRPARMKVAALLAGRALGLDEAQLLVVPEGRRRGAAPGGQLRDGQER
jgi:hypothetical protein